MAADESFEVLIGSWSLTRSIEDHLTSERGSFVGIASFVELPDAGSPGGARRLRYLEEGRLELGDFSGPARRSLLYEQREDASLAVLFSDGRPYIDLDLRGGSWLSRHHCGEDLYEISTQLHSNDELEEHWRVRGPAKDYDARTRLSRRIGPTEA